MLADPQAPHSPAAAEINRSSKLSQSTFQLAPSTLHPPVHPQYLYTLPHTSTMADALKAEGNKLFAAKDFDGAV